ncbi:MAG: Asp-tRNA(Asn)/Glu-tRNA(Gln) amidotransferase subunit GatC [Pseudomonadales bacterium]|nr:Asp-tRNA(Asn)/Glu-tRNA(Gln) amidotransferase subunit GatC [Pseudomonadales bacterium]
MKVDRKTVEAMADLAQLRVDDAEVEAYIESMSRVLDLVEEMQGVDTTSTEPLAHPLDAVQRLRPDEVTEADERRRFQDIAPETRDGLYLVPRVVE